MRDVGNALVTGSAYGFVGGAVLGGLSKYDRYLTGPLAGQRVFPSTGLGLGKGPFLVEPAATPRVASPGPAPGEQLPLPFAEPPGGALSLRAGVQMNKAAGDAVRDLIALREAPALTEQVFRTVGGVRRLDVLKLGDKLIGIESKVGRMGLKAPIRQELARDWWLLRQGQVDHIIWEFSPSPRTGLSGPNTALFEKIQQLGFEMRINQ